VVIRSFSESDLVGVGDCFNASVRVIAARYYLPEQVAAWAPSDPDISSWQRRLSNGGVFVADVQELIAGFVRAESTGLVDLLYVHPAYERRGIGKALLRTACTWAAENGAEQFAANVSLAAQPLFEKGGFRVEREQFVEYRGIVFHNFRMVSNSNGVPAA